MIRTWRITILREGYPIMEQVLTTRRGIGHLLRFVHDAFPGAEYVHAEAV